MLQRAANLLNTKGEPIPGAVIETWETDDMGTRLSARAFYAETHRDIYSLI